MSGLDAIFDQIVEERADGLIPEASADRILGRVVEARFPGGERCPTCGGPVRIVSTDEGTNYYEPLQ